MSDRAKIFADIRRALGVTGAEDVPPPRGRTRDWPKRRRA